MCCPVGPQIFFYGHVGKIGKPGNIWIIGKIGKIRTKKYIGKIGIIRKISQVELSVGNRKCAKNKESMNWITGNKGK